MNRSALLTGSSEHAGAHGAYRLAGATPGRYQAVFAFNSETGRTFTARLDLVLAEGVPVASDVVE